MCFLWLEWVIDNDEVAAATRQGATGNGCIGIGLRNAGEQRAIDQVMRECERERRLRLTLVAVRPFKVSTR